MDRSLEPTLEDPRTRRDTIKTDELPAIPRPEDLDSSESGRMQNSAFQTIQFKRAKVQKSMNEAIAPLTEAEIGIRKACENAFVVVIESLKRIEKTSAYKDMSTLPMYKSNFVHLLGILRDGEIGTRGLIFHLQQKCKFLESMIMEFQSAVCIDDFRQSLQICQESKLKLEQKIRG